MSNLVEVKPIPIILINKVGMAVGFNRLDFPLKFWISFVIFIMVSIYASFHNYLLFHFVVESIGIFIVGAMLIIAINTYHVSQNHFFMFLAIAYAYIGGFAFLHTITFKGMNLISGITANMPTQLYIITKYMLSISLLISLRYLKNKLDVRKTVAFLSVVSVGLVLSIYYGIFPDCFIEGKGLTPFKIYSEYINGVLLILTIILMVKNKKNLHYRVYIYMVYSIAALIAAGVAFTFYVSVSGLSNMIGHVFQLLSFSLIFLGIIETSLKKPYEFLYYKLNLANEELQEKNQQLIDINTELEVQQQELESAYLKIYEGIEKAREIHKRFLPKSLPKVKGIVFGSFYRPALDLGGDFFNVQKLQDKLLIYIVDVSGHGLDGAILNIFIRENINKYLISVENDKDLSPKEILGFLNSQYAKEEFPEEYYICMQVGVLDINTYRLTYCNAGLHISPFIINNKGELTRLELPGIPIFSAFDVSDFPYVDTSIDLGTGFTLLFTTDGLVEGTKEGEMYGEERLGKILLDFYNLPPQEIVLEIEKDFKRFLSDKNSQDDVTYLIIKGNKVSSNMADT